MLTVWVFLPLADEFDIGDIVQTGIMHDGIEAELGQPCVIQFTKSAKAKRPLVVILGALHAAA